MISLRFNLQKEIYFSFLLKSIFSYFWLPTWWQAYCVEWPVVSVVDNQCWAQHNNGPLSFPIIVHMCPAQVLCANYRTALYVHMLVGIIVGPDLTRSQLPWNVFRFLEAGTFVISTFSITSSVCPPRKVHHGPHVQVLL